MMKNNIPAPPPGCPSISQRADALKLAARSHTTKTTRAKMPSSGHGRSLFGEHYDSSTTISDEIPAIVTFSLPMDGDINNREGSVRILNIQKSKRPRFMRSKNKDIYQRVEKEPAKVSLGKLFMKK